MIKKVLVSSLLGAFMFGGLAQAVPIAQDALDLDSPASYSKPFGQFVIGESKLGFVGAEYTEVVDHATQYGLLHSSELGGKYTPFTSYQFLPVDECYQTTCSEQISVPEPGTLGLFGLALLALGVRRSRKS